MDEIKPLTEEIVRLSHSVDWWNSATIVMMVIAALAATGLVATQYIAVREAHKLSAAQSRLDSAKDIKLQVDLKNKDGKIAEATNAAGVANRAAGTANERAEKLEKEAADAKTEMAKQQQRAAIAERSLLELKEHIKPRRLTDRQAKDFVAALRRLPSGTIRVGWTIGGGDESFSFLRQLIPLFKEAGWIVLNDEKGISEHLEFQVIGVGVLVRRPLVPPGSTEMLPLTPTLSAIRDAFNAVGMDAQMLAWPDAAIDAPEVVIGSKPEPAP